jgi:hypothetical protein
MEGVMNDDVVDAIVVERALAPEEPVYQRNVPGAEDDAARVTEPVPQPEPGMPVGAAGTILTVAMTGVLVALVQVPLSNSTW